MPLSPPIPAPSNALVYAKVAAYCNQFMQPLHTYLAPAPDSSAFAMCVHYGWNLPTSTGGIGNAAGYGGGGGLAVLLVFGLILLLARKSSRKAASSKA